MATTAYVYVIIVFNSNADASSLCPGDLQEQSSLLVLADAMIAKIKWQAKVASTHCRTSNQLLMLVLWPPLYSLTTFDYALIYGV